MATVLSGTLTDSEAWGAINFDTLALLWGMIVLVEYIKDDQVVKSAISKYFVENENLTPIKLLWMVSLSCAGFSALFTNDTMCIALTRTICEVCHKRGFHPGPFMVVIAMSANIGSAATLIGNPQNAIIASVSGVPFATFLFYSAIAMVVSIVVNTFAIQLWFRRDLSTCCGDGATVGDADAKLEEGIFASVNTGPDEKSSLLPQHKKGVPRDGSALWKLAKSRSLRHKSVDQWKLGFERQFSSLRRASAANLDGLRQASFALRKQSMDKWEADFEGHLESFKRESFAGLEDVQRASFASAAHRKTVQINVVKEFPDMAESDDEGVSPTPLSRRGSVTTDTNVCCAGGFHASLKRRVFRYCLLLTIVATLIGFLTNLYVGVGWTAIAGALLAMCLDAIVTARSPTRIYDKVNWELLVFFSGLFIVIEGLQKTDLPKLFLTAMLPYMSINSVAGVCAFTAIITVGCNVFSNVPMVLLVSLAKVTSRDGHPPELPFGADTGELPFMASIGNETLAWILLGWVATVAGNLTLMGSVANLIVAEEGKAYHEMSFLYYTKLGFPITLVVLYLGVAIISGLHTLMH
jgi:Na+/H+ antiporter NhaD/arsenite permease-like protein